MYQNTAVQCYKVLEGDGIWPYTGTVNKSNNTACIDVYCINKQVRKSVKHSLAHTYVVLHYSLEYTKKKKKNRNDSTALRPFTIWKS